MKRRDFITLLGGAAAWPLAAHAQTAPSMRRIGVLTALAEKDLGWQRNFAGFVAGLREKGWLEGRDFRFQFRYVPGGNLDHLRVAAGELVALAPDSWPTALVRSQLYSCSVLIRSLKGSSQAYRAPAAM